MYKQYKGLSTSAFRNVVMIQLNSNSITRLIPKLLFAVSTVMFDIPVCRHRPFALICYVNKKQCSRQLQCEVPCTGNVVDSSLSSLSSPPGGPVGEGGLAGGRGAGDISSTLPYTALPHGASP